MDAEGYPIVAPHGQAQRSVNGVALIAAKQITLADFARILTLSLGFIDGQKRPLDPSRVVDKTGLTGEYDLRLRYQAPTTKPIDDDASETAPDLFVALTKQRFDVLVIDRAEKTPIEN